MMLLWSNCTWWANPAPNPRKLWPSSYRWWNPKSDPKTQKRCIRWIRCYGPTSKSNVKSSRHIRHFATNCFELLECRNSSQRMEYRPTDCPPDNTRTVASHRRAARSWATVRLPTETWLHWCNFTIKSAIKEWAWARVVGLISRPS